MPNTPRTRYSNSEKCELVRKITEYLAAHPHFNKEGCCLEFGVKYYNYYNWKKLIDSGYLKPDTPDATPMPQFTPPSEKKPVQAPTAVAAPEPIKCVAPTETACAYKRPAEALTTEELLAELEKRYQSAVIVAETARGDYFIRIAGNKQQYELLLSLLGVKAERHFSGQPYTMEQRDAHLNRTVPGPHAGAAAGVSRS